MFIQSEQSEIVNAALGSLAARGIAARLEPAPRHSLADVDLTLEWNGHVRHYLGEVKERPTAAQVAVLSGAVENAFILARHVPPLVADVCRQVGIHYADAAGNAYIDWGALLVDVEGRRPAPATRRSAHRPLRAFQPSGLRVVFALLARPDLVAASYRDLSEASDVALGSVHLVMNELLREGFVEERGRRRSLHRTRDLFDRWVDGYVLNLAPRLSLGWFDAIDATAWLAARVDVRTFDGQWGAESAACLGSDHLRPGTATVYVSATDDRVLLDHRLRRVDARGTVEFRERFWRFGLDGLTVPAPLVYADLIASGEPRLVEAARAVRSTDDDLRRLDAR